MTVWEYLAFSYVIVFCFVIVVYSPTFYL